MGQKVLVIGSGAREHTIAYTLLKAPSIDEVTVAPGNPGMLKDGIHTTQLSQSNHAALIEFVKNNGYDWVFVGPEVPLIEGIVDDFAAAGIKAFGPSKAAAQIEGSKDFAKQLMDRHNIPTAQYKTFSDLEMAQDYVHEHGAPIVIKADGLAAGKGVTVAMDEHTAQRALEDIFIDHRFGSAGAKVVIEDFLDGQEFSLMSFVNGTDFWPMPISQDHKRAYENDEGPNTGGMGVYSPVPIVTDEEMAAMVAIMEKAAAATAREPFASDYRGTLYGGFMLTPEGPKIVEFNVRFGDPETQVVLPLLESDLLKIMTACTEGTLADTEVKFSDGAAACVILASGGYPVAYEKGKPITGLVDGQLAGTAGISAVGKPCKLAHRAEFGIGILQAYWGQGIGYALTAACIDCARQAGYLQLELDVVADNARAIALYKKLGFVEYGRNPRGFRKRNGDYQELVYMRVEL